MEVASSPWSSPTCRSHFSANRDLSLPPSPPARSSPWSKASLAQRHWLSVDRRRAAVPAHRRPARPLRRQQGQATMPVLLSSTIRPKRSRKSLPPPRPVSKPCKILARAQRQEPRASIPSKTPLANRRLPLRRHHLLPRRGKRKRNRRRHRSCHSCPNWKYQSCYARPKGWSITLDRSRASTPVQMLEDAYTCMNLVSSTRPAKASRCLRLRWICRLRD